MTVWPRTWLFAPASDDRKLASALASGAEAVIADLEDAVALDRKEEARGRAVRFAEEHGAGPRRIVRINDPRTPTIEFLRQFMAYRRAAGVTDLFPSAKLRVEFAGRGRGLTPRL